MTSHPLRQHLDAVRRAARLFHTSTYEISATCNLSCEGCLFFSGEHAWQHSECTDTERWRAFFQKEGERGITFAFLAGAEPSLTLDRLRAAWDHIPAGMVVTNGTRRIPEDIGFRLHISLWGAEEQSSLTRGADVVAKALTNYAHDPRALFVYTINAHNIGDIGSMAHACAAHGVQMTFNYYSPTARYRAELRSGPSENSKYFRFSTENDNLTLSPGDYVRAKEMIRRIKKDLPETILYSLTYDDWVTGQDLYTLDPDGIARDCASRTDRIHRTFFVDQTQSTLKCSNPTFDCRDCRTYASGMTSQIRLEHRALRYNVDMEISDSFDCWNKVFVGNQWDRLLAWTGKAHAEQRGFDRAASPQ